MVQKMFVIRDSKGGYFHPPVPHLSHGEAERWFHGLANDGQSTISKYPEDFDLYSLGEYDNVHGKLTLHDAPQHMINAATVKKA